MTDKALEKLGIHRDGGKLKPKRYYCNTTQSFIRLDGSEKAEYILELIYEEGVKDGIIKGKTERSNQIHSLLMNEDL